MSAQVVADELWSSVAAELDAMAGDEPIGESTVFACALARLHHEAVRRGVSAHRAVAMMTSIAVLCAQQRGQTLDELLREFDQHTRQYWLLHASSIPAPRGRA